MQQQLHSALDQFESMGYTAHNVKEEATTFQFTIEGRPRLTSDALGSVMSEHFEEHIYAFASEGERTTVKVLK